MIEVIHFTDPACPWAYSARPAHAALQWRYGDQLRWRLVMIGLTEDAQRYVDRGYTPAGAAKGFGTFRRRFGMPFATQPRPRIAATSRACRAVVATRLTVPEREETVFRTLQFAQFTTPIVFDEDDEIEAALANVEGIDATAIVKRLDDPDVLAAYEADRAEARSAAGSPTEAQGKTATTDGPVRYTAPSLTFDREGQRLEAGGFQPLEAYDVILANLDPTLVRTPPPDDPLEALQRFPDGLVTQEVAAVMAGHLQPLDRAGAEEALIDLVGAGRATRTALGDDALWRAA
jgi:2-hydroxychromene-2-carboxylate isomerase